MRNIDRDPFLTAQLARIDRALADRRAERAKTVPRRPIFAPDNSETAAANPKRFKREKTWQRRRTSRLAP